MGGSFFSYVTQAKICHKFSSNSILGSKFDFSYAKKVKVCRFYSKSIFCNTLTQDTLEEGPYFDLRFCYIVDCLLQPT